MNRRTNKITIPYIFLFALTLTFACTVSLLFSLKPAEAGVEKLIKNLTPSGTMSNVTKGAIIEEQSAGHILGGSVIVKTPANPGLQLVYAQAPSCKFGGLPCGASFELLGGGVSLASSAELMRHIKSLTTAATYGGLMYLSTLCPTCKNLMTWLDSKADWINNIAKTDCEDMARLAGGALNKITAGSRATRQSAAVLNGEGRDMAELTRGSKEETDNPTKGNPQLESMLGDNFNLVWKALDKKSDTGAEGAELKEFLMSVSGTIIGTKDPSGRRSLKHKTSLVNKDMLEEFIGGVSDGSNSSEVTLYACDEHMRCLAPREITRKLAAIDTLVGKVGDLLKSITEKIQKNEGDLTEGEQTLIGLSSLPLINKIELDLKHYSNLTAAITSNTEFVEALSLDVLTTYLSKMLQEVQTAVSELEYIQLSDSGIFQKFDEETREIMRKLSRYKHDAFKRYSLIAQTKARIKQDMKYFDGKFEEFLSNQQGH